MTTEKTDKNAYPFVDLIPKTETQALDFSQNVAKGENTVIGILDTGVDPNAFGLQTVSTGKKKLINIFDCTGSGDISMSHEATAELISDKESGSSYWQVTGLSGRTLKLNSDWNIMPFPSTNEEKKKDSDDEKSAEKDSGGNDKKMVRLGIKSAYELFPLKLKKRIQSHSKQQLEKEVRSFMVPLQEQLNAWHEKHGSNAKKEETKEKESLEAQLEFLSNQLQDDEDPGPLYDVVVYYDETNYRAVIDDAENGDLTQISKGMTDYHKEQEWATFGTVDQYNYAVNFYNDGKVLSVVCDAGAHGSHVAGIASGNVDSEERNGVAPEAHVVALKIGDSRLGSMETGTSLVRAVIEAVRNKCDVVNLSYGEGCALPNQGRVIELIEELVWKHNIMFVSSAGNNGPALSTVGAPGGTSSATLGVAAYVSPAMMKADYSLILPTYSSKEESENRLVGTTYTWSSVGPAADGDLGVNITAPGGAISCVPNWTMQRNQLMNGTSMSSPHVAGCVALLISACKQHDIPVYIPQLIRAIQNTAQVQDGLSMLQQGWGMIQVNKAWDYLIQHKERLYNDVRFDVCVENRSGRPRGVYLRQAEELKARKQSFSISVNPKFGYKDEDDVSEEVQRRRIDFEMHFHLKTTKPSWVNVPDHFELLHNGRSFKIEVDPSELPAGSVSTAMVLGMDSQNPSRGVMFSVPITIVKPLPEQTHLDLGELEFTPAEVKRFFLSVPHGSTWMDVTVRDCRDVATDKDSSSRLVALHSVQLLPHEAYRNAEVEKYFNLLPSETTVTSVPVHAGITCELDLARYWSAVGTTKVQASVQFRGVVPVPQALQMVCGGAGTQVRVESHIMDETIHPTAKLTKYMSPLRPKKAESGNCITPLDEYRDVLPSMNRRIHELVLTYEFTQEEAGSMIPRAPALQGVLYESALESQLMLVFNDKKKYLGVADSWPTTEIKVPKGKVTIRLQIRHDSVSMLEKLLDMPIWIERKLEKEISLSVYKSKQDIMVGKDTFKKRTLRKGSTASVFFAEPKTLPTSCKCGDVLFGTAHFCADNASLPGHGKKPGGFPISFVVGPAPAEKPEETKSTPEEEDESVKDKIANAVRDVKVGQLDKLTGKEKDEGKFEELYQDLVKEYPHHIPLLMSNLKHLDGKKNKDDKDLDAVVAACDQVLAEISQDDLALYFGKRNHDKDDPASCKKHKEMEELKSNLVQTLARKARAVSEKQDNDTFFKVLDELKLWEDIDNANHKYAVLVLEREERASRWGNVLKLLSTLLKEDAPKESGLSSDMSKSDLLEKRSNVLQKLGYNVLAEQDKKRKALASPNDYMLF